MKVPRFFQDKNYKEDFENEFYTLIQLARETPEIRQKLLVFLKMNDFNRKSFLNTWISDLRLQKAPKSLINGLSCLLDDDVAQKADNLLRDSE